MRVELPHTRAQESVSHSLNFSMDINVNSGHDFEVCPHRSGMSRSPRSLGFESINRVEVMPGRYPAYAIGDEKLGNCSSRFDPIDVIGHE